MAQRGPQHSLGRLLLKALAITSALTFLAIMMVNACISYAPATKAAPVVKPTGTSEKTPPPEKEEGPLNRLPKPEPEPDRMVAPATKSMTVVQPRPLLAPATKSDAVVRPRPLLMDLPPEESPQRQGAPPQQGAPPKRGAP